MVRMIKLLPLLVCLISCSIKVVSFENPTADFGSYQTFTVVNSVRKANPENMENNSELEIAIIDELESRGYSVSSPGDLIVEYQIIVSKIQNMNADPMTGNMLGGRQYFGSPSTFREGILMVEVFEAISDKLVWQGSLDLKFNRKARTTENAVNVAAMKLFEAYPLPVTPNAKLN